jgi:hypothetical protein
LQKSNFQEFFEKGLDAETFLINLRWPDGFVCPYCKGKGRKRRRNLYRCNSCQREASFRKGTFFEGSRIKPMYWLQAAWYSTATIGLVDAQSLKKHLGISRYASALHLNRKIKKAMSVWEDNLLSGSVYCQRQSSPTKRKASQSASEVIVFAKFEDGIEQPRLIHIQTFQERSQQEEFRNFFSAVKRCAATGSLILARNFTFPSEKNFKGYRIFSRRGSFKKWQSWAGSREPEIARERRKVPAKGRSDLRRNNFEENPDDAELRYGRMSEISNFFFETYSRGLRKPPDWRYLNLYLAEFVFKYNYGQLSHRKRFEQLLHFLLSKPKR